MFFVHMLFSILDQMSLNILCMTNFIFCLNCDFVLLATEFEIIQLRQSVFSLQRKYLRRLKAIRATLESSPFFRSHEVCFH